MDYKNIRAMQIGKALKEQSEQKGISETEIALNMGLKESGQANINRYLNGKLFARDETFLKIGKAIGLSEEEIKKIFKEADIEEFMHRYGESLPNTHEMSVQEALEFIEEKAELSEAEKLVLEMIKKNNK